MDQKWIEFFGWFPAVIFPAACIAQLCKLWIEKTSEGVSSLAWASFGFANISLYIYTEKYASYQALVGMLGQAAIDFAIAGSAIYLARATRDAPLH